MVFLRCVSTFAVYILLYHSVSVKNTMIRVMQFSGPAPVSLFPPPETGEGEGGGEDQWRTQAVLLPPIPPFPRQGGRGRRPREARRKSRTEWPCTMITKSGLCWRDQVHSSHNVSSSNVKSS